MTKQEIEREISRLNDWYIQEKSRLENELFELEQLEKEKQSHAMKYDTDFYIDIFKHLLQLENTYCNKVNDEFSCNECKFVTKGGTCIRNWLISEFGELTRQAKKEIKGGKIDNVY